MSKASNTGTRQTPLAEQVSKAFNLNPLPETGFLRINQIVGDPGDSEANPPKPPIPAIFPIGKSSWWAGVKSGRFPRPVKLGPRTTAWRVGDIRKLAEAQHIVTDQERAAA